MWRRGDIGPGYGTSEGKYRDSGIRVTLVKPMDFKIVSLPPRAPVVPESLGAC